MPILSVLLAASLIAMPHTGKLFAWAFPFTQPPVYSRGSFLALAASHLLLVIAATGAAAFAGIAAAIGATRPAGRAWRPVLDLVARTGQAFPPAAVLALLVPAIGLGAWPTAIALFAYGLMPITENTLTGLENVPPALREAAAGNGLSPWQSLTLLELPCAGRQILAGVRTAASVALGTATIGSTVGALTLGTPIIDGLVTNKPGFVLQGAIPLALLAVVVDLAFELCDRVMAR